MPPSSPKAPALPFSQLGRDRAGPWGQSRRDASPAPQRCPLPAASALSPPACMLCRRAEADPAICGCKRATKGLCAHTYCLVSSPSSFLPGMRLLCSFQRCFICGEMGAAITCGEKGCDRSFHLPCASRGECITQFFGLYRSFCWEHRPEQAVKAKPGQNSTCVICLDPVEDNKSYHTMVCPACQRAWFHRSCIQKQAIHAGVRLCCLHCRNQDRFVMEMLAMGIRISKRWFFLFPTHEAFGPVYQRHRRCNASKCLCPGGSEQAEEEGPWQVLLCSSCAAKGTHRRCLYLSNSATTWECNCCAGLGAGKRQSTRVPLCCYGQCPS
uniref:RING-type domain-containing protein n=1 Tax=Aquila chrysaetos chrysaetos TaxID=223781 RepID=A0A663DN59_AQUCH